MKDLWMNAVKISTSPDYDQESANEDINSGVITSYFNSRAPQRTYKNTQQQLIPKSTLLISFCGRTSTETGAFANLDTSLNTLWDNGFKEDVYSDRSTERILKDSTEIDLGAV